MQKAVVKKLQEKAEWVAQTYSRPDREKNATKETFKVEKIEPLSEFTACVHFRKNTGKTGLAFFYYIQTRNGYWEYFFPTDSHIIGMERFGSIKMQIEIENWDKNFDDQGCENTYLPDASRF